MLTFEHFESCAPSLIDKCVERLREGAVVVVDVQRLQHLVADEYNRSMLVENHKAWATPEVFTLNTWLGRLWSRYELSGDKTISTLLSPGQAKEIWENVIAEHVRKEYQTGYEYLLWHITATANQVKDAYGLLCSYDMKLERYPDEVSADVTHFRIWLKAYLRTLGARNCIDYERLADQISKVAGEIFGNNQPKVVFAGIDTWTPQLERLIDSIRQSGGSIEILDYNTGNQPAQPTLLEFDTTDDELEACARWVRATVQASPEIHRVGIVAPNLKEIGPRLSRRLAALLNPDAVMESRQTHTYSFHVTLGNALSDAPIVVDAMNLLELIRQDVPVEVMSSILLSDRIKDWESEAAGRSTLAAQLNEIGGDRLSIENVIQLASHHHNSCEKLVRMLKNAKQLHAKQPDYANYAHWGQFFMEWIKNFQSEKKGVGSFGIDEWQAYESWVSVVQGLSELGFVASRCKVDTALAKLIRRVSESSVQPRAVRTSVQVGEYRAMAGQSFTHLWMLGMNDKNMPGSPQPNPFLPISLQKSHAIAMSSAAALHAQVQKRYDRIVSSAKNVVQSYARLDGGEHFQKSSFLVQPQSFDFNQSDKLSEYEDFQSIIAKEFVNCEQFVDWQAPPVVQLDRFTSGGTSLLKDQSNCPFRAFASHRLHLKQASTMSVGVTRLARGSMVHRLMERLHRIFPTHESLQNAEKSGELEAEIKINARAVVEENCAKLVRPYSEDVAAVEIAVLINLAGDLITSELISPEYKIWEVEHATDISLAGMTLNLRIDRIDEVTNGKTTNFKLIDYKSGNCAIRDVAGARPKDPQLAIYAVAFLQKDREVDDVVYIQLKDGKLKNRFSWSEYYKRNQKNIDPVDVEFGRRERGWEQKLDKLAAQYVAGEASANPLPYACEYCHVPRVCRITSQAEYVGPEQEEA